MYALLMLAAWGRARGARTDPRALMQDPICLSRLSRSTQVATESAAVLFDTTSAGDGAATARGAPRRAWRAVRLGPAGLWRVRRPRQVCGAVCAGRPVRSLTSCRDASHCTHQSGPLTGAGDELGQHRNAHKPLVSRGPCTMGSTARPISVTESMWGAVCASASCKFDTLWKNESPDPYALSIFVIVVR